MFVYVYQFQRIYFNSCKMVLKLSPNIFLSTGVTIANSKSENQKKSQQRKRFDKFLRIKYFTIIRSSSDWHILTLLLCIQ